MQELAAHCTPKPELCFANDRTVGAWRSGCQGPVLGRQGCIYAVLTDCGWSGLESAQSDYENALNVALNAQDCENLLSEKFAGAASE